jgi:hypothetical protein
MKNHKGFAVLFVLAMSSGLLAVSLAVWHQTSLLYDLVFERELQLKNTAVTHAFFDASIIMLSNNSTYFMEPKIQDIMPLKLIIQSNEESLNNQAYAATLILNKTKSKNELIITLLVMKNKKNIKQMRWLCCVHNHNKKRLMEISHVT